MKTKFTKGKLLIKEQGDANEYCILTEQGKWIAAVKLNGEMTISQQREMMNLMSAAPDLLEACKSIQEYWNTPQAGSLNDHIEHSLKLIESAIKKATP
jgi:hypothetical protein